MVGAEPPRLLNRLREQITIFFPDQLNSNWSCTGQSVGHDERLVSSYVNCGPLYMYRSRRRETLTGRTEFSLDLRMKVST